MNEQRSMSNPIAYESEEERIEHLKIFPIFRELPLVALRYIAGVVTSQPFEPGDVIFRAGQLGPEINYLYLVFSGSLRQYGTAPDGVPWLERHLKKGDMFGRYTLLTGKPQETTVEATQPGVLYRLHAADLDEIIARWPEVQDRLIPEKRIHRLRGLPLYSFLPDDHIRRLADHIEEKVLPMGEVLDVSDRPEPTVWLVAEGQVIVTEPGSTPPPRYETAKPLSLNLATVGFAFLDGYVPQVDLPLHQVRAVSQTTLYGLTAQKFQQLVEYFLAPAQLSPRDYLPPQDMGAYLRQHQVFGPGSGQALPEEWWSALSGFTAWIYSPRFQTVVQQGGRGHSLYVLVRGEAIVRAVDERGRRRPRNYLFAGDTFGRHALLFGVEYDETVEATDDAYWLRISREDLSRFNVYLQPPRPPRLWRWLAFVPCNLFKAVRAWLARRPFEPCWSWRSVWERLGGQPLEGEKFIEKQVGWREPDEEVLWAGRKHVAFFIQSLILPTFSFSFSLALLLLTLVGKVPANWLAPFSLLFLVTALWLGYVVIDYLNDFYAVTDRRIVHQDRVLLWREVWEDVPLERVQDVIQQVSFLGNLLGYSDLRIQTAAEGGGIVMRAIPDAAAVRSLITGQRRKVRAKQRAWQRERLRQDLQQRLFVSLLAEWPPFATGEKYPPRLLTRAQRRAWEKAQAQKKKPAPRHVPPAQRWPWRWIRVLLPEGIRSRIEAGMERRAQMEASKPPKGQRGELTIPWGPKTHWRSGNTLYWRKHPLNMLRRVAVPLLLFFIWLEGQLGIPPLLNEAVGPSAVVGFRIVSLLFLLLDLGWLIWRYDDWRNDLYVLTPNKLIDLERRPFFLQEERREAPLDRVQNVRLDMHGLLAQLFNYGNVVIQTAAAGGDITFHFVPAPRYVAREISRYLEEFRRRREEEEYMRQQAQFAQNIEVYDELVRGRIPRTRSRRWMRDDL